MIIPKLKMVVVRDPLRIRSSSDNSGFLSFFCDKNHHHFLSLHDSCYLQLVSIVGIEPTVYGVGGHYFIQLNYTDRQSHYNTKTTYVVQFVYHFDDLLHLYITLISHF